MNNNMLGCINVAEYVPANAGRDVADDIQRIIDENPNRTLFFPDGEYLLSHSIMTPAHPNKSVSLELAAYAAFRASADWQGDDALVRLGAIHSANDIRTVGSNYYLSGGIIDGSGVASGISIDGGRETVVRGVSIKHVKIGLHIKRGANSGSSDADINGVNIIGNGHTDSIGVLLEGYDNTLTNMRIADVQTGMLFKSAGNSMRNIHPLYTCSYEDYENSCGFRDLAGNNWYSFCYSDHFGIGFYNSAHAVSIYDSCFTMWYNNRGERHVAFACEDKFNSIATNLRIGYRDNSTENIVLAANAGGSGKLERLNFNQDWVQDQRHIPYWDGVSF